MISKPIDSYIIDPRKYSRQNPNYNGNTPIIINVERCSHQSSPPYIITNTQPVKTDNDALWFACLPISGIICCITIVLLILGFAGYFFYKWAILQAFMPFPGYGRFGSIFW